MDLAPDDSPASEDFDFAEEDTGVSSTTEAASGDGRAASPSASVVKLEDASWYLVEERELSELAALRLAKVGTLPGFPLLTWMGRGVRFRATMELVLCARPTGTWGTAGRGAAPWTLTVPALTCSACCADMGCVVATLIRAKLGAMLLRSISEKPEKVESRKSPGIKKCWSCSKWGVEVVVLVAELGKAGTGGTRRLGESGGDRFWTPGIYAIWMTFDARVKTVEAIEWADLTDCRVLLLGIPSPRFSATWPIHEWRSSCFRFFIFHKTKTQTMTKTTPPTTPPMIAPIGVDGGAV